MIAGGSRTGSPWPRRARPLLEWVDETRRKYPHAEAVRFFLKKVTSEQLTRSAVQWALGHASASQRLVIFQGMATLDKTPPPHWG
jgi:hypothetical protein